MDIISHVFNYLWPVARREIWPVAGDWAPTGEIGETDG